MNNPNAHKYFKGLGQKGVKKKEAYVHRQVTKFLDTYYPNVRYLSNLAGEKFHEGQKYKVQAIQHSPGAPDLMIFHRTALYTGLAIELKGEGVRVFKKDGSLRKSEHLSRQMAWLKYLRRQGWKAEFGLGYDQSVDLINEYML